MQNLSHFLFPCMTTGTLEDASQEYGMVWRKEGDTWDESDSDEEEPEPVTVVSTLGLAS